MSRFVRTQEEVDRIQQRLTQNRFFDVHRLSVSYRTTPAIAEKVIPPGLEPADEPLVRADVVNVGRSNCVGSFSGGGLYVQARYGDLIGDYCLSMPMSTDAAITWGRELFGEPKKHASISLDREGDDITGRISRHGETILEIDATMRTEQDIDPDPRPVFHYKYQPDVTGRGFQFEPTLVSVSFESDLYQYETGRGNISLSTTDHDPFGELEVVDIRDITFSKADLYSNQENLTRVDPEAFLPYAYGNGRVDDWLALDNLSDASLSRSNEGRNTE